MTSEEFYEQVQADPAASFYLKDTLSRYKNKDPVDAHSDALTLLHFCELRVDEALRKLGG